MIIVEFLPEREEIESNRDSHPETMDTGILTVTYFYFPVRINVNGVELFAHNDSVYQRVELLGLFYCTRWVMERMKEGERTSIFLDSGKDLLLTKRGDRILFESKVNEDTHVWESFQEAWRAFAELGCNIRDLFMKEIPILQNHSDWKEWFPDDLDVQAGRAK